MAATGWIQINNLHCKGCELCVQACPQHVMSLDKTRLTPKGYHPVTLHADGCTGCAICAIVCPEAALTIYRQVEARTATAAA